MRIQSLKLLKRISFDHWPFSDSFITQSQLRLEHSGSELILRGAEVLFIAVYPTFRYLYVGT